MDEKTLDRAKGCLLGLAVGDALGTSVEFLERDSFAPVNDMIGGGVFSLPPGFWTDDTSMALCLADSLLYCKAFNHQDLMSRFSNWMSYGYNSSTGECFDIGSTTRAALLAFLEDQITADGPSSPGSAGNGSIMRLAPSVLACLHDRDAAISMAEKQSRPTHAASEALEACRLMGGWLYDLVTGRDPVAVPGLKESKILDLASGAYAAKGRREISSSGYVVHTLEAALWAVSRASNFKEALLLAVNLGEDADTVGAVAGQFAGAKCGYSAIPQAWLQKLFRREGMEQKAVSLSALNLDPSFRPAGKLTPQPGMP